FSGSVPAVVLFVDTSGFTALTASLSTRGKEGAEILAGVLVAVFEPLIQSVYAHGGFIAGFAGDAFKAVFTDGDPVPALAAAEEIRRHMAAHAAYTTPYGVFSFAVRASLASGHVTWHI